MPFDIFEKSVFLSHGSVEKESQDLSSSPPKRIRNDREGVDERTMFHS